MSENNGEASKSKPETDCRIGEYLGAVCGQIKGKEHVLLNIRPDVLCNQKFFALSIAITPQQAYRLYEDLKSLSKRHKFLRKVKTKTENYID